MRRQITRCLISTMMVLMSGCANYLSMGWQAYEGPPRPKNKVAFLKMYNPNFVITEIKWGTVITASCVDGRTTTRTWDGSKLSDYVRLGVQLGYVSLSPGHHAITFLPGDFSFVFEAKPVIKEIDVEAGKTYLAKPHYQQEYSTTGQTLSPRGGPVPSTISNGQWSVEITQEK